MFFLLRCAFWLSLVVLLLPADDGRNTSVQVSTGEAFGVARAFVSDVGGFCERNPSACETGESALKNFGSKAQYGAKLVYSYIGEFTGDGEGSVSDHRTVATTRVQVQPHQTQEPLVTYEYPAPANGGPAPSAVATYTGTINGN
ncbi:DUF5330 domain-containing protein [Tepidamorphus sp. 3E244]|uniref:DUF5330 domain-containing protein n=1 Tax=Tepidamorphus sp. 3E244 TaxID=3385498 RepID=UPI0038FBE7EC